MKQMTMMFLLISSLLAQANSDQPYKHQKEHVSIRGCVLQGRGDYILIRSQGDNRYLLRSAGNVKLAQYLGKEVRVKGTQSTTLSNSADSARSARSKTIAVKSVDTIAEQCWF